MGCGAGSRVHASLLGPGRGAGPGGGGPGALRAGGRGQRGCPPGQCCLPAGRRGRAPGSSPRAGRRQPPGRRCGPHRTSIPFRPLFLRVAVSRCAGAGGPLSPNALLSGVRSRLSAQTCLERFSPTESSVKFREVRKK